MTTIPQAPSEFVYVSKDTFFAAICGLHLNIHPNPERVQVERPHSVYASEWRMLGWSYNDFPFAPHRFALHPELVGELIRAGVK